MKKTLPIDCIKSIFAFKNEIRQARKEKYENHNFLTLYPRVTIINYCNIGRSPDLA
jgi:hypothetical protein